MQKPSIQRSKKPIGRGLFSGGQTAAEETSMQGTLEENRLRTHQERGWQEGEPYGSEGLAARVESVRNEELARRQAEEALESRLGKLRAAKSNLSDSPRKPKGYRYLFSSRQRLKEAFVASVVLEQKRN